MRLPWKDGDGRVITARVDAELRLAQFVQELHGGPAPAFVGQDRRRIRFGDVASRWWDVQTASPRTRADYRALLNHKILPTIGTVPVGEITKANIQQLVIELHSRCAAATVKKAVFVCRAVLDYAVDVDLIQHNPANKVRAPKIDRRPLRVWTPEQVQLFLDSFPPDEHRWRTFASVLLLAGLRFSEAAALTPGQVAADTLVVDRAWDEFGKRVKPTKSNRASTVDLHPRLKRDLFAHLEHTEMGRDALLFPGARRGGCVSKSWFGKKVWRPAIVRADAALRKLRDTPREEQLPIIRPHDARHTFVAHLLAAGANPVYVKEQAGHHSAAFTLDVYGHLIPSQKRAYNLPTNAGTLGDSARPLVVRQ
jgi:integrase